MKHTNYLMARLVCGTKRHIIKQVLQYFFLYQKMFKIPFSLGRNKQTQNGNRQTLVGTESPDPPEEKALTFGYLALTPVWLHCSQILH